VPLRESQRLEGDVRARLLEQEVDVMERVGGRQLGDPAHDHLSHLVQPLKPSRGVQSARASAHHLRVQELGLGHHVMQLLDYGQPVIWGGGRGRGEVNVGAPRPGASNGGGESYR
jgi:hypothetical protein